SSRGFFDLCMIATQLQTAPFFVEGMPESPKQQILIPILNLYVLLFTHALILRGSPLPSSNKSSSTDNHAFFETFSYDLIYGRYSLHDLAHGILRGNQQKCIADSTRQILVLPAEHLDPRVHFVMAMPLVRLSKGKEIVIPW